MVIEIKILIELYKMGFKLVPLCTDGKTPSLSGLLTYEERLKSLDESSDGKEHPVNYVYNHPEFWNEERIKREAWRSENVATTFGRTHLNDENGNNLYLNQLDIDSEQVFTKLANIDIKGKEYFFIDEMCKATYITQTRKKWGRHIFWLSRNQNPAIGTKDCKSGCEFEIKTDNRLGLGTLPPSTHRDDSNFHYQCIGQNTISIQDGLYDGIVKLLSDCIKTKNNHHSLSEEEIQDISESLMPYYHRDCKCRNDIVFALCGFCHKNMISKESMQKIIETLASDDEEKKSRLLILDETCKKRPKEVSGVQRLLAVLEHATGNSSIAKDIFQKIFRIITSKSYGDDDRTIDHVMLLTEQLTNEYTFKTLKDTGKIYYYDNSKGVYVQKRPMAD